MRFLFLVLASLALTAGSVRAAETVSLTAREVIATANGRSFRVTLACFHPDSFTLRVIDNAAANDTGRYARLAQAMAATGAAAGCNGGFFNRHPFDPVGLMIAGGNRAGTFEAKSWMQGLVVVRAGQPGFEDAATFHDAPEVSDAIQSGPWLVREGKPATSNDARVARRSFVCEGGNNTWAIGLIESCTLDELAAVLTGEDIAAVLDVHTALNLDGGPSTGLWIRGDAGDYSLPERWTVRNYLAVMPREAGVSAKP